MTTAQRARRLREALGRIRDYVHPLEETYKTRGDRLRRIAREALDPAPPRHHGREG